MVYGQSFDHSGRLRSYAVSLDVVGHEIFHGVIDRTARLEYAFESGALNESYSDIFGIIIANTGDDFSVWNWEMGEELDGTGVPIRNLRDPTRHNQPSHMSNFRNLPNTRSGDWGGVHINSGIHNKAAYNVMVSKDENGNFLFTRNEIAVLFYLTLTNYLSRTSKFKDSLEGLLLAARTYFRNDPGLDKKLAAIMKGFNTAGIL